jgi:putative copper resistance protein D
VGIAIAVAAAAVAYVVAVRRVVAKGRRWPPSRSWAWAAALAAALATLPVGDASFTRHMVEHVVLGMAVPLLATLAAPITLVLQGGGPATRATLRRVLRSRVGRILGNPVVGFAAFGVSLAVLYLTPLLEASVEHDVVHALVHAHLVLVGMLFLVPLVGVDALPHQPPFAARLLALLLAVPFHAFLALALATADEPVAPDVYPSIDDQRSAAAVLWASGELFTVVVGGIIFWRWWTAEARAASRESHDADTVLRRAELRGGGRRRDGAG